MAELTAPQQNRLLAGLSNLLRRVEQDSGPEFLPRGLDVMGLVRQLALPSAETVEKMSYGDPFFRMPTQSNIPITTDRGYLAEVLGLAPAASAASRATTRLSNEAADALVRQITRNPEATAPRVLEEARMPIANIVSNQEPARGLLDEAQATQGLPKFAQMRFENVLPENTAQNLDQVDTKLQQLKFNSDIPNLNWLQDKQEYSASKGFNEFNVPRNFGNVTGYFAENQRPLIPVDILKRLPGMRGEQQNVRSESLDYLLKKMSGGRLPKGSFDEDYAPFINVDQNGNAYVNEGNHRIMAAERLGFDYLPVEIKYFNGGELVDSELNPKNIAAMQIEAENLGYTKTNYAKPK